MLSPVKTANINVRQLDLQHVFHSWSVQGNLDPLVIAGGQGCRLWDYEDRQYLDFSSQLINTNIGHQHPKVIEAIQKQAASLCTIAPAVANQARGQAARLIVDLAPSNFRKVFFTNAGADANENAIRMARLVTGRTKVLSAYRSYHGSTGAAIAATGDPRRIPNEYAQGHVHFFNPYLYRSEFSATSEQEECERALQHLRRVIECEGPSVIAAILMESIPGTAGILVPPAGYMQGVRALANEFGIMLILDEVMAGFGRTGEWFAFKHFGVVPDLITFAKGVNSGYVPAGGVLVSEKVDDFFQDRMFPGGLTYSGHPLAMAAIVATLQAMQEEDMLGNVKRLGSSVLEPAVRAMQQKHAMIGEVRGIGFFWALELVADPETRKPLSPQQMVKIKASLTAKGLLSFIVENRIHLAPPCIATAAELNEGLQIIDEVLQAHTI